MEHYPDIAVWKNTSDEWKAKGWALFDHNTKEITLDKSPVGDGTLRAIVWAKWLELGVQSASLNVGDISLANILQARHPKWQSLTHARECTLVCQNNGFIQTSKTLTLIFGLTHRGSNEVASDLGVVGARQHVGSGDAGNTGTGTGGVSLKLRQSIGTGNTNTNNLRARIGCGNTGDGADTRRDCVGDVNAMSTRQSAGSGDAGNTGTGTGGISLKLRQSVGSGNTGNTGTGTAAGPIARRQSVNTGDTGNTINGRQNIGSGDAGNTGTGTAAGPIVRRQSVGTGNTGNTNTNNLRAEVGCGDTGNGVNGITTRADCVGGVNARDDAQFWFVPPTPYYFASP
ncbi:hypothetical protein FIBSPDRAFT_956182 [Athelia psychrophila]|uniref:Uncharacterized protein n=1 Tax=Athelia psychrophila TaxID=1759441 RepID=A0A166H8T1_9AGAM|nr:hypothetical protein FIBSPDRAFT_956182 [Fibularhizoctonia sp. CBS 109695]